MMKVILHSIERREDGLIDLEVSLGNDQAKNYQASFDGSDEKYRCAIMDHTLFMSLSNLAHKRFGNCVVYQMELMGIIGAFDKGDDLPPLPAELGTTSFCTFKLNPLQILWKKFLGVLWNWGIRRPLMQ